MATRLTPSKGSKPDKLMADALRVALHREALDADGKPTKRLNLIADRLVQKAVEGDIAAIKEVFDRIDGRVIQRDEAAVGGQIVFNINTGIVRDDDGASSTTDRDPLLIEAVMRKGAIDDAAGVTAQSETVSATD